jgi:hypothetical protein
MSPAMVDAACDVVTVTSPLASAASNAPALMVNGVLPAGGTTAPGPEGEYPPGMVMTTSRGSSSHSPPRPTVTSASAPTPSAPAPEVSTNPPATAPVATMRPSKNVVSSAQAMILPPCPSPPRAEISAPDATVRWSARRSGPLPRTSPPIRTEPPSIPPSTRIRAAGAIATRSPVITTSPPRVAPPASIRPDTSTAPEERPTSSILPPAPLAEAARITPEVLIAASTAPAAAPALKSTRPPPTSIKPPFETPRVAVTASPCTAIRTSPSPLRSIVVLRPEASATVPCRATITPSLATLPPTSAASPASPTVISPRFSTRASRCSPPSMRSWPDRWNLPASTDWLVATSPPVSIRAVPVKSTPALFWMITVPGAVICPAIRLAPPVRTRLRVAERAPGWSK